MDINEYRNKGIERERTSDLLSLIPDDCNGSVLDIGARDGWFSIRFKKKFEEVVALDLVKPNIDDQKIKCIEGDITRNNFIAGSYDLVFCAEVLEHIPVEKLKKACIELEKICKKYLIIGVPYKQDIRVERTTCKKCKRPNPPWGHLNSFDEFKLSDLFPTFKIKKISFVGENNKRTNFISTYLLDIAGNPYGTYEQDELCVHCGSKLENKNKRNLFQKISTRIAFYINDIQPIPSPLSSLFFPMNPS